MAAAAGRRRKEHKPPPEHPAITYRRTFPYGAPKVRLFGDTFHVKDAIKAAGFRWVKDIKGWEGYFNKPELVEILADLTELYGCVCTSATGNSPEDDLTQAIRDEINYRNEE